jgi:hypothetical protein
MASWDKDPVVNSWDSDPVAVPSGVQSDPIAAGENAKSSFAIAMENDLPIGQAEKLQAFEPSKRGVLAKAKSLAGRLGKQLFNRGISDTLHALGGSDQDPAWTKASEIQEYRQKYRDAQGEMPFSSDELDKEFDRIVKMLRRPAEERPGSPYPNDPLSTAEQFLPKENPFEAEVKPASGTSEKVIDAGTGVLGFWAQTVLLKKAAPKLPDSVAWETVNIANGGPVGAGASMQGVLAGTTGTATRLLGKGLAGQIGGATATSSIFGITTYLGGGDTEDILINMGIPYAFGASGITKEIWKRYPSKDLAIQAIKEKAPALKEKPEEEIAKAIEAKLESKPDSTISIKEPTASVEGQTPDMATKQPTSTKVAISEPQTSIDVKAVADKAIAQIRTAEKPRAEIELEKTAELGRRVSNASKMAETVSGEQRAYAAKSQLKGELTDYKRPDFTPLRETLTQPEIDVLFDDIWKRPHSPEFFDKIHTNDAFQKVVEGYVPTRNEILLLEKQFGSEIAKGLLAKRPFWSKFWGDIVPDISNFMRTMQAGGDISIAGRQLRALGLTPKFIGKFGKAIWGGMKSYWSAELSKEVRKQYESSEYHKEAKKYLEFFDPAGTVSTAPEAKSEFFVSGVPEKIPALGRLIRAGNRNYVETANMFLQGVWDKLRIQDAKNGIEPTREQLKERGDWIMAMTGRPKLGKLLGKVTPTLGGFFYAPRFSISRFTTPLYLSKLASNDPVARQIGKDTAKSFASLIGVNLAIMAVVKSMNDDAEVELDPRSADWGKIKIGDNRTDLWAGYIQAARFLVQMATSEYKTAAGKIKERDRTDTVGRFVRTKVNPLASLIADLWAGQTFNGDRPFDAPKGEMGKRMDEIGVPDVIQGVGKEAYNRMTFLWVQDFLDAAEEEGWLTGLEAGAQAFAGINVSTYPETAYTTFIKFKDEVAQKEYGKNWEDLGERESRTLSRKFKDELAEAERKVKLDKNVDSNYEYVGKLIEEEKEAGQQVKSMLSPDNQKALDELGIQMGFSKNIGDWVLNDERFGQYQIEAAQVLEERLSRIVEREGYSDYKPERKEDLINSAIESAKEKARAVVKREANRK